MLNHISIMGRMTKDPELRRTNSGTAVASFTLAVDRDYKQGDEKLTDFIDVVCWRNTAKFVSQFFSKGRMAIVDGKLESSKYEDKDGNKRISWAITANSVYFADSKKDAAPQTSAPVGGFEEVEDDGNLPF